MSIFSKVDKKVLLISVAILVVILLLSFFIFNNLNSAEHKSSALDKITTDIPQVQIQVDGVQAQGNTGGGMLSVCLDKCGDGICQTTDLDCAKDASLACICLETPQDCQKDCK